MRARAVVFGDVRLGRRPEGRFIGRRTLKTDSEIQEKTQKTPTAQSASHTRSTTTHAGTMRHRLLLTALAACLCAIAVAQPADDAASSRVTVDGRACAFPFPYRPSGMDKACMMTPG